MHTRANTHKHVHIDKHSHPCTCSLCVFGHTSCLSLILFDTSPIPHFLSYSHFLTRTSTYVRTRAHTRTQPKKKSPPPHLSTLSVLPRNTHTHTKTQTEHFHTCTPHISSRDGKSQKLEDHDFLGTLETTMGAIVGSRGSTLRSVQMCACTQTQVHTHTYTHTHTHCNTHTCTRTHKHTHTHTHMACSPQHALPQQTALGFIPTEKDNLDLTCTLCSCFGIHLGPLSLAPKDRTKNCMVVSVCWRRRLVEATMMSNFNCQALISLPRTGWAR